MSVYMLGPMVVTHVYHSAGSAFDLIAVIIFNKKFWKELILLLSLLPVTIEVTLPTSIVTIARYTYIFYLLGNDNLLSLRERSYV
jgi:hypothetical protein